MSKWTLMKTPTSDSWNNILKALDCNNLYQTYEWGKIQSEKFWTPYRLVLQSDTSKFLSAVQIFSKKKFGINIIWIPGGIAGDIKNLNNSFRVAIKELLNTYLLYIRCNIYVQSNSKNITRLQDNGWTKPLKKLTSEKSILMDISCDEESRLLLASKNWRHNLRRAKKRAGEVKRVQKPNIDELLDLYAEMEARKGLTSQFTNRQITKMFEVFSDNLFYYECRDGAGELIAIRAIVVINDIGWDILAASNLIARKNYSTYALIWQILNELQSCGIKKYNLGGIDPKKNPGVYNFKKGLGGIEIDYLGEYEWSNNKLLKNFISYAL